MNEKLNRYYSEQFDAVAHEMSALSIACDIDIFAPGAPEKILNNDTSICGRNNPEAFEKLRHHFLAVYPMEERAIERIGAEETKEIIDGVLAAIRRLRNEGRPGSSPDTES